MQTIEFELPYGNPKIELTSSGEIVYKFDFIDSSKKIDGKVNIKLQSNEDGLLLREMEIQTQITEDDIGFIYIVNELKISHEMFKNSFPSPNSFVCNTLMKFDLPVESSNNLKCLSTLTVTYFKFIMNQAVATSGIN